MEALTNDFLQAQRLIGDPLADDAVAEMIAEQGVEGARLLFDQLIRQVETPVEDLPPSVEAFLSATARLPAWVDPAKIALAQKIFIDHGPKLLIILYYQSLPMLYACAQGAEVLVRTARLTHGQGRDEWQVFTRRVAETAQFLLGVMAPDALQANGSGIQLIQKVRLIHASVRFFLQARGDWAVDELGVPINQEDMAITVCSFGISPLAGLERMGIALSEAEREAYVHCWSAIGQVMGVREGLLPQEVAEAQQLEQAILARQERPSQAGQTLTSALLQFGQSVMPREELKVTPQGLLQFFSGPERAQLLGVAPNYGCISWLIPEVLAALFRSGERLEDRSSEALNKLFDRLSIATMQAMFRFFDEYKNRHFYLPPGLRDAWGLSE